MLQDGDLISLLFFMGDPRGTAAGEDGAQSESDTFGDIVRIGGTDSEGSALAHLHVNDGPVPFASRTLLGMAWLLDQQPAFDYINTATWESSKGCCLSVLKGQIVVILYILGGFDFLKQHLWQLVE